MKKKANKKNLKGAGTLENRLVNFTSLFKFLEIDFKVERFDQNLINCYHSQLKHLQVSNPQFV